MSLCVELGLGKCPYCQIPVKYPPYQDFYKEEYCWSETYKRSTAKLSDAELKDYVLLISSGVKTMNYNYAYWCMETIKKLYPSKAALIEKMSILL